MLRRSFFAALCFTVCAFSAFAQTSSQKRVLFSVTDPLNRFVTGLDREAFEVVENGVIQPITRFAAVDLPIALAVVSDAPLAGANNVSHAGDEFIEARSVAEALQQLSAAKNSRKVLVASNTFDTSAVPEGVQVIKADPAILTKAVVEARNQYLVQFESSNPSTAAEVVLRQPRGLPPLKVHVMK